MGFGDNRANSHGAAVCGSMTARGDLTSANTVGYTTINLEADKWYLVIPQFTKVGVEEAAEFNALDVMQFSGLNAGTYLGHNTDAPQIQVHRSTDNGYTTYFYIKDAKQSGKDVTAWATARAALTSIPVKKFKGFWFKATGVDNGATITVSGQVRQMEEPISIDVGVEGQWQMIGNPYPCDLCLENISVEGLVPGTYLGHNTDAPQIQVHRPSDNGYTTYFYIKDAKQSGKDVTAWATARAAITSGKICDAGKGFWVKVPSGTGKLVFKIK